MSDIPTLDHGNYTHWAERIIYELRRKDVIRVLDDPKPEPPAPVVTSQSGQGKDADGKDADGSAASGSSAPADEKAVKEYQKEVEKYETALEKWKSADNVAAGIITSHVGQEFRYLFKSRDPARTIWEALESHHKKSSSGIQANNLRVQLIEKRYEDGDDFDAHISHFRDIHAQLTTVNAGFEDSFLAWLLCYSLPKSPGSTWSIATSNIFTNCDDITKLTFHDVAGKLREAHRSDPQQSRTQDRNALKASTSQNQRYHGDPCTYPGCRYPKTHGIDTCRFRMKSEEQSTPSPSRAKQKEKEKHKKKHGHAKVVHVQELSSDEESSDESEEEEEPRSKTSKSSRKLLKATARRIHTFLAYSPTLPSNAALVFKANTSHLPTSSIIAYVDSGCSQHMSPERDWFDAKSFRKLDQKLPIYLGDNSIIYATGIGNIDFLFNVNGEVYQGGFKDVLYVPKLKATLLSISQTLQTGKTCISFDGSICQYIDKATQKVHAVAIAKQGESLYTLDATPLAAKNGPSWS